MKQSQTKQQEELELLQTHLVDLSVRVGQLAQEIQQERTLRDYLDRIQTNRRLQLEKRIKELEGPQEEEVAPELI